MQIFVSSVAGGAGFGLLKTANTFAVRAPAEAAADPMTALSALKAASVTRIGGILSEERVVGLEHDDLRVGSCRPQLAQDPGQPRLDIGQA